MTGYNGLGGELAQKEDTKNRRIVRIGLRAMIMSIFVLLIFVVNFVFVLPIFSGGYTSNLQSFEGALISEARFISHFFPNLSWNPLWHLGFPFSNFYTPLLPGLVSFLHFLFSFLSFSYLYRIVAGVAFILSPLTLYLFVKYLTRKELPATIAALAFSGPASLALSIPYLRDQIVGGGFVSRRFLLLVTEGQGAHLLALVIIPLGAMFYLHSLRYPSLKYLTFAAVCTGLIALSNWVALVGFLLFLLVLLFSEMILGDSWRKIRTTIYFGLLSYGLIAFWYNFSFLKSSYHYAQDFGVFSNLINLVPLSFVILPIISTVLFLIFDRRPRLQPLFIGFVSSLFYFVFIGAWNFYRTPFLPHPNSLAPEFVLSSSIFTGVIITLIVTFLQHKIRIKLSERAYKFVSMSLMIFIIGVFIYLATWSVARIRGKTYPHPDIKSSQEYQIASFLDKNNTSNARVYLAGSASLWFNVFTDIPQVKGYAELGDVNPVWKMASEEIEQGSNGKLAVKWLQTLNVKYLVVTPVDFRYFEKFESLTLVKEDGGYKIFEVPGTFAHYSKVVDWRLLEDVPKIQSVKSEEVEGILDKYLQVIAIKPEFPKLAQDVQQELFNKSQLKIMAPVTPDKGILVAQTFQNNWVAKFQDKGGERIETSSDPLGFILIKPKQNGKVNIDLRYYSPLSFYFGYGLTFLTVIFLILMQIRRFRKVALQTEEAAIPKAKLILPERTLSVQKKWWEQNGQEMEKISKESKGYYKTEENYDWVKSSESFGGMESIFHKNREELILKAIKEYGQRGRYLDAGCGTGLILRNLPSGSVGLDINPRAVALAKKYAPQSQLVVADIDEMPFEPDKFANVICSEIFDRLPNPGRAISEVERVLKPGGVVMGTAPRYNPLWRLIFLSSNVPLTKPYHREYTEEELIYLLRDFEIVKIAPALSKMTWFFVARKRIPEAGYTASGKPLEETKSKTPRHSSGQEGEK